MRNFIYTCVQQEVSALQYFDLSLEKRIGMPYDQFVDVYKKLYDYYRIQRYFVFEFIYVSEVVNNCSEYKVNLLRCECCAKPGKEPPVTNPSPDVSMVLSALVETGNINADFEEEIRDGKYKGFALNFVSSKELCEGRYKIFTKTQMKDVAKYHNGNFVEPYPGKIIWRENVKTPRKFLNIFYVNKTTEDHELQKFNIQHEEITLYYTPSILV